MFLIRSVVAYEILDSRGNPTVEVKITLENGISAYASVPSGASTGSREALELRDHDPLRYLGKGALTAVNNINTEIQAALKNKAVHDQKNIDQILINLDNTPNKSRLGANALLGVSLAVAKTAAIAEKKPLYVYLNHLMNSSLNFNPNSNSNSNSNSNFNTVNLSHTYTHALPVPLMNIINGGAHADNNIDIQEFMIVPVGANSFKEALRYGAEIFHGLKKLLSQKKLNTNVGDEGGFAPNLSSHSAALDFISEAVRQAGFTLGKEIYLALDIASSEFYKNSLYELSSDKKKLDAIQFTEYLENLVNQYPIISIEDGMAENDWAGWTLLTQQLGRKIQLVGDDLFVTNTQILAQGIQKNIANAILIKPNQIGTLTETLQAIQMAKQAGYAVIISHRSGETEDSFIADFAVGTQAGQIKTGSLCRSDRMAKYNQLLRIEQEILSANDFDQHTLYAGKSAFRFL